MGNKHKNARCACRDWMIGSVLRLLAPGTGIGSLFMICAWTYVAAEVYNHPEEYAKYFDKEPFIDRKADVSGIYDDQNEKNDGDDTQK